MFHKEGHKIILLTFITVVIITLLLDYFSINHKTYIQIFLIIQLIIVLQFFRNPKRITNFGDNNIVSPVDGKVVVIEEVFEPEYFKEKRIQVSIFMSPINVHVTRYPIGGQVTYSKYHPGKYLVAWHPKSSTENERTSIVIKNENCGEILYRQIAGALAKRIVNYAKESSYVNQGDDAGFIKFGSRVDLYIPINSKINVNLNQRLRGGEDIISEI
jgi:phosphatidylserine decarboxylase